MLFEPAAYDEIATHASQLNGARERAANLWRDGWNDRADAIQKAYAEAVSGDTPAAWRRVCELAVDMRMEMRKADGHETIYFTESVLLTDLIEKALLQARANPQNLIAHDELRELKRKAIKTQEEIHAEYERTPFWQSGKRRRLEEGEEMVRQTVYNINVLSDVKLSVSVDLAGAVKSVEIVIGKSAEIVGQLKQIARQLSDGTFTKSLRQAAEDVWEAGKRFASATVRRFRALNLPEPRLGVDDAGNGPGNDIAHAQAPSPEGMPVRIGAPAREAIGLIKPGSGRSSSDVFWDIEDGPEMVVVPAGKFMMGSLHNEPQRFENESPRHEVTFARPFAVGRHAVTRGQFAAFVNATGHADGAWRKPGFSQDEGHPVVCISWDDAKAYAAWLAKITGRPYRLLSEAEWEYAARAGTTTPFWWGSSITPAQANYDGNYVNDGRSKGEYRRGTVPVGSFDPNPWGLYNVHGNVWEWCEDIWHDNYDGAPTDGSAWISDREEGSGRVVRGGSWGSSPGYLRAAFRIRYTAQYSLIGFRLARTLAP